MEKQNKIYELMSFFIIYRVTNDIDDLKSKLDDKNKKIESTKDKKLNLNFFRNSSVKTFQEEIEFKTKYIEKIKANLKTRSLSVDDINTTNIPAILNDFIGKDDLKLQRYLILAQVIQVPLYYSFVTSKFEYSEEKKDFSLSNISTFLGLDGNSYQKIFDDCRGAGVKLFISLFSDQAFSSLKYDKQTLKFLCPLAIPSLLVPSEMDFKLANSENKFADGNIMDIFTLSNYKDAISNKYFPSDKAQKSLLSMNANEVNAFCYINIMLANYLLSLNKEAAKNILKLIVENTVNWRQIYEKDVLLGTAKDLSLEAVEGKLKTSYSLLDFFANLLLK